MVPKRQEERILLEVRRKSEYENIKSTVIQNRFEKIIISTLFSKMSTRLTNEILTCTGNCIAWGNLLTNNVIE